MRLKAVYKMVTPGFVGGADPHQTAELRLPSIKGQLRWWWRALAWAEYSEGLSYIASGEAALFGSAKSGRGQLSLWVDDRKAEVLTSGQILMNGAGNVAGQGTRYLGYGVLRPFGNHAGELLRPAIGPKSTIEIVGQIRAGGSSSSLDLLRRAFEALGTFGGVGTRSRRGFGSLVLSEFEWDGESVTLPSNLEDLNTRIRSIVNRNGSTPPYTAFSQASRVVVVSGRRDPLDMHNVIGSELLRYRGWRGIGEQRFRSDHDLMNGVASGQAATSHPGRAVFGLPHPYYFSSTRKKATVKPAAHNRRASPLLIHIHRFPSGGSAAVLTFLPSEFLPNGEELLVGQTNVPLNTATLWDPINEFLDRVRGTAGPNNQVVESNVTAVEVLP